LSSKKEKEQESPISNSSCKKSIFGHLDSLCKNQKGISPVIAESIQKQLFKRSINEIREDSSSPEQKSKIDQSVSVFDNMKLDLFSMDSTRKQVFCESEKIVDSVDNKENSHSLVNHSIHDDNTLEPSNR
jgi:hypothetical protein